MDASHLYWKAADQSVMRSLATCLKWEVGSFTSAKAKGPLNIKGLSFWLAYLYMQLFVLSPYEKKTPLLSFPISAKFVKEVLAGSETNTNPFRCAVHAIVALSSM